MHADGGELPAQGTRKAQQFFEGLPFAVGDCPAVGDLPVERHGVFSHLGEKPICVVHLQVRGGKLAQAAFGARGLAPEGGGELCEHRRRIGIDHLAQVAFNMIHVFSKLQKRALL